MSLYSYTLKKETQIHWNIPN